MGGLATAARPTGVGAALIVLLLSGMTAQGGESPASSLRPFTAHYAWTWHGMTVAVTQMQLARIDAARWRYTSSSDPRGIARLYGARPHMASTFTIEGNQARPLLYTAEDGTGGQEHWSNVTFDWAARRASGVYSGTPVDLVLLGSEGDDLSVQVSMMLALQSGHALDRLAMIDRNTVKTYAYTPEGRITLVTRMGPVDTDVYAVSRTGTRRVTRFWCAPRWSYLPAKVEQRNHGNVEWALEILDVNFADESPMTTSPTSAVQKAGSTPALGSDPAPFLPRIAAVLARTGVLGFSP